MAGELNCDCRKRLASGFELNASLQLPFDVARITVLFGPSGAGKTTLLRLLAGLDRPLEGSIVFCGVTWFDSARDVCLAPQQRRAGYFAQDYALFPHLTVFENVVYGAPPGKRREHLKAFGLEELGARYPRELSSGQRQRVALARALAAEPALVLLDEPLSALDAATRARTRQQLRTMLLASGVPCIIVTHDRMEAIALGDWIAVISKGARAAVRPHARCPAASGRCRGRRVHGGGKCAARAHREAQRRPAEFRNGWRASASHRFRGNRHCRGLYSR
ncbi:MAG: ATP-binding cassette domain-containing protein [Ignavibacteriota bacterium]